MSCQYYEYIEYLRRASPYLVGAALASSSGLLVYVLFQERINHFAEKRIKPTFSHFKDFLDVRVQKMYDKMKS